MTNRTLAVAAALVMSVPFALSGQEGPVTSSLKGLHDTTQENILATAQLLDEELYAFRPTEEVRSMGEVLAHVANAQFFFCSTAAGEDSPNAENYEETRTTKAEIIEALEAGFGYCTEVYGNMTDAKGSEIVSFFGQDMAVSGVLAFNSAHNYEHYGNLVTYMRLNGITPPSSR